MMCVNFLPPVFITWLSGQNSQQQSMYDLTKISQHEHSITATNIKVVGCITKYKQYLYVC
jgi:hypothetical protein